MKLKILFSQFPNPWTLRVSGMGGYTSKCEKSQNHCTLHAPMIYTSLYVMIFDSCRSITWKVGGGWAWKWICTNQKHYALGHINHRCKNSIPMLTDFQTSKSKIEYKLNYIDTSYIGIIGIMHVPQSALHPPTPPPFWSR